MVGKKRKSEVFDNSEGESLLENSTLEIESVTPTKRKKKKINDLLNSEIATEQIHSVKKTKSKKIVKSDENGTEDIFDGEDVSENSRKFSSPIPSIEIHNEPTVSSDGYGLENGIVQTPTKHERKKKLKKQTAASPSDIVENGVSTPLKKHVSFALELEENHIDVENSGPVFTNPKKKRKRDAKLTQEVTATEDEPIEEESAPVIPVVEQFSAKAFRKSLKAPEGSYQSLKTFVSLISKQKEDDLDVMVAYMEAGGSAMEILQQLETKEQETFGVATAVFTALHAIIMRSLTDMPDFRASCEEASRYLLNAYLPTVQRMMSEKASAQEMKATLKLLTGVVSINPVFAKDVLANVKFSPSLLKIITKPIMLGEKSSVRTCFVHFLMAFLVDKNVSLIRTFLDKQGLLASILPGMIYDKAETVHLVLTTVRTSVVENKNVSKSLKRLVFNTGVIKLLLRVYAWHGPRKAFKKVWHTDEEVDTEARAIVTAALQQLMLVLCTSHKLGVVFVDRSVGTARRNVNELMYSVLREIERPWENEHTRDLVVRILVACPDLVRSQLNSMQNYLEPRVSTSWLQSMDFLKQMVSAMDPDVCLKPNVRVVAPEQLASVVELLCAPPTVLQVLKRQMLLHSGLVVRQAALELLVVMFEQARRFLAALEGWGVVGPEQAHSFRARVTRYLPRMEVLLQVWNEPPVSAHGGISAVATPIMLVPLSSHLSTLLDLMLLRHRVCPLTAARPGDDKTPSEEPSKLELSDLLGVIEQVEDETDMAAMQVKAVQVIFEVDPRWFQRDKDTFSYATQLLMKLLHHPAARVSQYVCSVLTSIFQKTGLFDASPGEADIWIHCYRQLDGERREAAAKLLSRSLMRVANKPAKYRRRLEKTGKKPAKQEVLAKDAGSGKDSNVAHLSPLLPGILSQMKKAEVEWSEVADLLTSAVVHLAHSLTTPSTVSSLVEGRLETASVGAYVRWSDKDTDKVASTLESLFGRSSVEYKLGRFVLGKKSKFADAMDLLEGKKKKTEGDESDALGETQTLGSVHLLLLFNLALFQATQLISTGALSEAAMERCGDAFKAVLQMLRLQSGPSDEDPGFDLRCVRKFLSHPVLLNSFVPFADQRASKKGGRKLPTELIVCVVRWIAITYPGDVQRDVFKLYREKIVKSLVHTLFKKPARVKKDDETFASVVETVKTFEVDYEDTVQLLKGLTSKPTSHLLLEVEDSDRLSTWGELFAYLIGHAVDLRTRDRKVNGALPSDLVTAIANVYVKLRASATLDLSALDESLIRYLEQFPHGQASVPHETLAAILKTGSESETSTRLGVLLLSRNKLLGSVFGNAVIRPEQGEKLVENSLSIFSYCSVFVAHGSANSDKVLRIVYERYREDVVKWIKKPHKAKGWMVVHTPVVASMIDKCMSKETCAELCDYVEGHVAKLTSHGLLDFHVPLIESLFTKAGRFATLARVLLELMTRAAQTDKSTLDSLCKSVSKCADRVDGSDWREHVQTSAVWFPFATQMLKSGLRPEEGEYRPATLLETLASLGRVMYRDGSDHEEARNLFEMTLSHSEFLNVMLGSTPTKPALVRLISALVAKCPAAMSAKHVPVLLGAYNATLSLTDRAILSLLNAYEAGGVSMSECRPYLWGEAAVNYYSVKTREAVSLWRQPQMSQVLELLNMETVQTTVRRFPLNRTPDPGEGTDGDRPYLYDPAFFLPLFSHLLAPEAVVQPHRFTHSGGIALTLASLASNSRPVRDLAYHVLARYRHHLDAARGRDREWWLQFLDAVRAGVGELGRGEGGAPQLACVVATFLARASLVISRPLDPMFAPLNKYILAKPAMNLNTIPELYILFNSTDLNSKLHRHFLLEILRDGLRLSYDWKLAMKCVLFQLLFVYYSSIVSNHDERSKVLILEVVNTAVQTPDVAKYLIGGYGFLSWFHQTVRQLSPSDHDLAVTSIQIVNSLWQSVAVSKVRTQAVAINKKFFTTNVALLLVGIVGKLPPTLTLAELNKFLVLTETVSATSMLLTRDHVSALVEFCKGLLGPLDECEDMLEFGCRFVKRSVGETVDVTDEAEQVKTHLRRIIVLWWESTQHDLRHKSVALKTKKKMKTNKKLDRKLAILKTNKFSLKKKGANIKVKVKTSLIKKKTKKKLSKDGKPSKKKLVPLPVQDTNS